MGSLIQQQALFNVVETFQNIGTTPIPILPPNPLRVSVVFGVVGSGRVFIMLNTTSTLNHGMSIAPDQAPLEFFYRLHGALVQQGFFAVAEPGAPTLTIWETSYHEEYGRL